MLVAVIVCRWLFQRLPDRLECLPDRYLDSR